MCGESEAWDVQSPRRGMCRESRAWNVQRVRGVGCAESPGCGMCRESEATQNAQNTGSLAEENGDQGSMVEAGKELQGSPLPSESLVERACDNPSQVSPGLLGSQALLTA